MVTHYKIKPGSSGGFMCPPGHPNHSYEMVGYESPRHRTEIFAGSIGYALTEDFDGSPVIRDRVQRIMDAAELVESDLWVRSVYGYFRSMYVPASGDRNASNLINHNPAEIAADSALTVLREAFEGITEPDANHPNPHNYRRGVTPLYGRRRGFEITAKADGSRVYVYALADDGSRYDADHLKDYANALDWTGTFTNPRHEPMCDAHAGRIVADVVNVPAPMDPERHAAVACIRQYFPDHTPRLDLIENPGKGYGSYPCDKCGESVQYEAKFDALAVVSTRLAGSGITQWSYKTDCDKGGNHEVTG
jgi:hypothetical protein